MPGTSLLAAVLLAYAGLVLGLGVWARGRIRDKTDFLVAGRRLPLSLAAPTLLATWFGAGTLLTATDEVRAGGLRMAALDPLGAGLCLILAGWWLARPLWRLQLLTLSDFFRKRYGTRAEAWSAVLMLPTYFGWIAAQFVALAQLLDLLFGIPVATGIAIVAALGTAYTLLGGMWSVTVTDALQLTLVIVGLVVLTFNVLSTLGGGSVALGFDELLQRVPAEKLVLVPTEDGAALVGWLGVLAVGSLGNLPGQDLTQRIFSARSESVAVRACFVAGVAYLTLGTLPLTLGLAADVLVPGQGGEATVALLSRVFLSPGLSVVLILAIVSAVLSTIDSAILSPASVLAENLIGPRLSKPASGLWLHQLAVLGVATAAVAVAYSGESAYGMLEDAYSLGLVSLLVPLLVGIKTRGVGETGALVAMAVGTTVWGVHWALGWDVFAAPLPGLGALGLPVGLSCASLSAFSIGVAGWLGKSDPVAPIPPTRR